MMYQFTNETGYTKISVWKDENPIPYQSENTTEFVIDGDDTEWYQGTICIEAQLNVWHRSNYATLCVKYTKTHSDKTEVIIHNGIRGEADSSELFRNTATVGLDDDYVNAVKEYFLVQPHNNIPCGRIEIIGAYDEMGSSNVSFRNVMNLVTYVFCNESRLEEDGFGEELFQQIREYWKLFKET